MCALRSPDLHTQPLTTLAAPAAPDGFYALSKLLGEEMCKYFSSRHGLETVCLRIGWCKCMINPALLAIDGSILTEVLVIVLQSKAAIWRASSQLPSQSFSLILTGIV